MRTVDERVVRSSADRIFELARNVEQWPERLAHYRWVRFRERRPDGGGIVEMAANRPFGPVNWPTRWLSEMQVVDPRETATTFPLSTRSSPSPSPVIRFRHIGGITRGMDVEWSFTPAGPDLTPNDRRVSTLVRIVHVWDGPHWPMIGGMAAIHLIGPVFVHGIASRTLAGLAAVAEQDPRHRVDDAGVSVTSDASPNGLSEAEGG